MCFVGYGLDKVNVYLVGGYYVIRYEIVVEIFLKVIEYY